MKTFGWLKYAPILLFGCVFSCATPPDYPIEPYIEFIRVSKDTMRRGAMHEDTTFVTFSFTDGDGDIGHPDTLDLFVKDTRLGVLDNQFIIPVVPKLGKANGLRGEITFRLFTTCCNFPKNLGLDPCKDESVLFPYDPVVYEIFMVDQAGHKSNVIKTTPIYIRCKN